MNRCGLGIKYEIKDFISSCVPLIKDVTQYAFYIYIHIISYVLVVVNSKQSLIILERKKERK